MTYADVMDNFGLHFYSLRHAMGRLGNDCRDAGEPILTSLIVDKETQRCSQGIFDEFHIDDDSLERKRCYEFWGASSSDKVRTEVDTVATSETIIETATSSLVPKDDAIGENLSEKAARFARVEVRQEQQAFRKAVFFACKGRCVISGCDIPEALEAAHFKGRSWREGNNSATDGVLLRRDLHALYDNDLISFDSSGQVQFESRVRAYYIDLLMKPTRSETSNV